MEFKNWQLMNISPRTSAIMISLFEDKKRFNKLMPNLESSLNKVVDISSIQKENGVDCLSHFMVFSDDKGNIIVTKHKKDLRLQIGEIKVVIKDFFMEMKKEQIFNLELSIGNQTKNLDTSKPPLKLDHVIIRGIRV